MKKRSTFSSRAGFVIAAAGSAVGLGNLWRFPYLAAKYGGGMFLLIYIIFVITFGFTIMVSEIAIGRKTRMSAVTAYKKLDKRFSFIGYVTALVPLIVLPYYSVIGGWVSKYVFAYITGGHMRTSTPGFFDEFTAHPVEPVFWLSLFIIFTFLIVLAGVKKGIERSNKILMPILIILILGITIYTLTLPGAMAGLKFYFTPRIEDFSVSSILAALGQMFYSTSLASGIMITYGSYMKSENDIEKSVKQIEIFDTVIAVLAGLMIIPAVFVFSGGDPGALSQGPSLMFVTMPQIFGSMSFGGIIGVVFFILVFFAAITSSVSMSETVVSMVMDKFGFKRVISVIIVCIYCLIFALPSSLGFGIWEHIKLLPDMNIFEFFDYLSNNIIMPIVALLSCIFVAYVIKTKAIADEVKLSSDFKYEKMYNIIIKFFAPILLVVILVSSIFMNF